MPFRCFAVCQTSCNSTFFIRAAFLVLQTTACILVSKYRFMANEPAHNAFAWQLPPPRNANAQSTCTCKAPPFIRAISLYFEYAQSFAVHRLPMFVLACAACHGFDFVMVFVSLHTALPQKHTPKPCVIRSWLSPLHGFFYPTPWQALASHICRSSACGF